MKRKKHTKICTRIFTRVLLVIAPSWKQPRACQLVNGNKLVCPPVRYHSVINRKELLIHTTAWMNLKNIMLSERSQTRTSTYRMIPFISTLGKISKSNQKQQKADLWLPPSCGGLGLAGSRAQGSLLGNWQCFPGW